MPVFLLLLAVPLIEIALFVVLGGVLGLWLTLFFVLGSTVLGAAILRRGGQIGQPRSRDPMMQMAGKGLSLLAGLLLIVPGFFTSALGLLLLLPPVQRLMVLLLGQRLSASGFMFRRATAQQDDIIEGEYEELRRPQGERLPPSQWTQD